MLSGVLPFVPQSVLYELGLLVTAIPTWRDCIQQNTLST